jgi:hypothetical protein
VIDVDDAEIAAVLVEFQDPAQRRALHHQFIRQAVHLLVTAVRNRQSLVRIEQA